MNKRFYHIVLLIFVSSNLYAQVKIITRADNLFFIGIDNGITLQSSKIPVEELTVRVTGGTVSGKNGNYVIRCSAIREDGSINVFHKDKLVAEKKMNVQRISDPQLYIAGDTLVNGGSISKKQLLGFDSLVVKINVPYLNITVVKFGLKRISENLTIDSLTYTGHVFSSQLKEILSETKNGDMVVFDNAYSTSPDMNGIIHPIIKLTVRD